MKDFPKEFDHHFYRSFYKDLHSLSESELHHHYLKHGIFEERIGSSFSFRENLRDINDGKIKILEIGPFSLPS